MQFVPGVTCAEAEVVETETLRADYQALAAFRYRLRCFLAWSERAAREAGLEPQQHQMMLAICGLPTGEVATIGAVAERLQLRHHTTAELASRLEAKGLVMRSRTGADQREVVISLTLEGERRLAPLVRRTLNTLTDAGPELVDALNVVRAYASHR